MADDPAKKTSLMRQHFIRMAADEFDSYRRGEDSVMAAQVRREQKISLEDAQQRVEKMPFLAHVDAKQATELGGLLQANGITTAEQITDRLSRHHLGHKLGLNVTRDTIQAVLTPQPEDAMPMVDVDLWDHLVGRALYGYKGRDRTGIKERLGIRYIYAPPSSQTTAPMPDPTAGIS